MKWRSSFAGWRSSDHPLAPAEGGRQTPRRGGGQIDRLAAKRGGAGAWWARRSAATFGFERRWRTQARAGADARQAGGLLVEGHVVAGLLQQEPGGDAAEARADDGDSGLVLHE